MMLARASPRAFRAPATIVEDLDRARDRRRQFRRVAIQPHRYQPRDRAFDVGRE